jgi:hypothetical protein
MTWTTPESRTVVAPPGPVTVHVRDEIPALSASVNATPTCPIVLTALAPGGAVADTCVGAAGEGGCSGAPVGDSLEQLAVAVRIPSEVRITASVLPIFICSTRFGMMGALRRGVGGDYRPARYEV